MEISEKQDGKFSFLTPVGRLDNETSPDFQIKLLYAVASGGVVVVDLSRVEYISSAGLRALMMASKKSKAVNGQLGVASLAPMVKEIFDISRFSLVVQVFDTVQDATAALS